MWQVKVTNGRGEYVSEDRCSMEELREVVACAIAMCFGQIGWTFVVTFQE